MSEKSVSGSLFYVVIWITCSCSMILFNKAVLSKMNFAFPMFLTTWHMFVATVLTQVLSRTTNLFPSLKESPVDFTVMKKQMFPVAFLFTISLIFSNKAYIYLSVSYIQMLKAFTPVAVLALSVLNKLETSTFMEVNIIAIISLGVALASIGELQFSLIGFFCQATGLLAESGRLVLTNVLLKKLKLDSLSTLYYLAPLCFAFNLIAFTTFELPLIDWSVVFEGKFIGIMLLNGLVAFSLNIASVMLIQNTSALALTLAGVVKDVLLVLLSLTIFGSPVSILQYLGYGVALLALNLHKDYKKLITANPHLFGPVATAAAPSEEEQFESKMMQPMKV